MGASHGLLSHVERIRRRFDAVHSTRGRTQPSDRGGFARSPPRAKVAAYNRPVTRRRDVLSVRVRVTAGEEMAKASERMKGTVKWFNDAKGYGFITPTDGGDEMFVHQSAIKADGYRTLAEGETVQFTVAKGDDGRTKAVDVTRPDGGFVQGAGAGGGRRNLYGGGGGRGGGDRGRGRNGSGGYGGSWYGARSGGGRTYGGGRGYGGGGRGYGGGGGGGGPCYNCGETGHLARDCYQGGGFGGGGGSCYSCGEAGHFARDCPRK